VKRNKQLAKLRQKHPKDIIGNGPKTESGRCKLAKKKKKNINNSKEKADEKLYGKMGNCCGNNGKSGS